MVVFRLDEALSLPYQLICLEQITKLLVRRLNLPNIYT